MTMADDVPWSADLGGGAQVALVQAGTFLADAGAVFGPVPRLLWERHVAAELTADQRILQALNCLLVETPGGRVLIGTGIGERVDERTRTGLEYAGWPILPSLRRAGFDPATVDVVALSHLHPDHAGGLLDTAGGRAFPRARIVAQRAEWEGALGDNPRAVAGYDQPEIRLVRDWGAQGWVEGESEVLPGVSVVPTGGYSVGHQAIIARGSGRRARTVAFFGGLAMRPWSANPRWVTAFDDFPLDAVLAKGALFRQASEEGWIVILSHEPVGPVGRLVADRDRFRFEPA